MAELIVVECYSGHTYAQEPRAFVWRGQRRAVACVERAWQSPEGPCFLVRTEGGERFLLAYRLGSDEWYATQQRNTHHANISR